MNFREAPGRLLEWHSTDPPFSNFQFVDSNYRSHRVVRRIFSLARKLKYRSLLIEEIAETDSGLLREEDALIKQLRTDFRGSKVHRLHFFKSAKDTTPGPDDYLGYLIYKENSFANQQPWLANVFECVIQCPRQRTENNFLHSQKVYQVNSGAGRFSTKGILYAQQNGITNVCAHASLRTVLASVLPSGDVDYSEINRLAGVDHTTILASKGLDRSQIEKVMSGFGLSFRTFVHDPSNPNAILPIDYQRHLYGLIESGRPALLGFELKPGNMGHMVSVVGHTFNEDTWVAEADRSYFGGKLSYYPSENWLSSFVIHDDNLGPYLCSPRHFLQQTNFRLLCGVLPFPSQLNSVDAEALAVLDSKRIASGVPKSPHYWYNRFWAFSNTGMLVFRSLLVEKAAYIRHVQSHYAEAKLTMDNAIQVGFDRLPDNFWLVELSAPELFSGSRRKFGEILIPPNPSLLGGASLFGEAARLPGLQLFRQASGAFQVHSTPLVGHTSLFSLF